MSVPDPAVTDWVPLSGGAYVPLSTIDAIGDLIIGTGNDAVTRLANPDWWPYTLEADDSVANKVKWAIRNASYNVSGSRFSSDLNNCKQNGWYHNVAGNTVTNCPAGLETAGFLMRVHGRTNDLGHMIQEITSIEADATSGLSRKFVRRAVGGAAWGPWLVDGSAGKPTYSATPPGSPADGDEWIFPVDATNGVMWRFRYRAASASAFKWEFVGGPPFRAAIDASEGITSATYADLATVGPSLTLARAGDYDLRFGAILASGYGAGYPVAFVSPKIGAAVTSDADAIQQSLARTDSGVVQGTLTNAISRRKTIAANDVIKLQYRTSSNACNAQNRWLEIIPIRIS